MIQISKQEAFYLREKGRDKDIIVSSKTHHGKAKRYYLTESKASLKLLNKYRENGILVRNCRIEGL